MIAGFLMCLQLPAAGPPSVEIYSEGVYSINESNLSNLLFARAFLPATESLSPYFQIGSRQNRGTFSQDDLFFSPGLVWNQKYFRVFGEHRLHSGPSLGPQKNEWRLLFSTGFKRSTALGIWSSWYFLAEPYSEALLSLSGQEYFSLMGLLRLGVERAFTKNSGIDLYVEPFLVHDNQFQEKSTDIQLRPSVRWRSCEASLCFSLILANLISLKNKPVPDFLFVGSVGGTL